MKFKTEVEIDYLGEADDLDSVFIEKVSEHIITKLDKKVTDSIIKNVWEALNERIDKKINTMLEDFMNRAVTHTDKWGDKIAEYASVNEMLKTRFDEFATQPVDEKGNVTKAGCGYNQKTRFQYFIDKKLEVLGEKLKETITNQISNNFKKETERILRESVAEGIIKNMDIKAMMK